jgi:hypothetical protein
MDGRENALSFYRKHRRMVLAIGMVAGITVTLILLSPVPHLVRIQFDGRYAVRAMLGSDFFSYKAVASSEYAMRELEDEVCTRPFLTYFSMRRICGLFCDYRRGAKDCVFAEKLRSLRVDEDRTFMSLYIMALNSCQRSADNEDLAFIDGYEKASGYVEECKIIRSYLRNR